MTGTEWMFIITRLSGMGLKINDEWADETLIAFSNTPDGAAEIERQWAEYGRRGRPFMSYQGRTDAKRSADHPIPSELPEVRE